MQKQLLDVEQGRVILSYVFGASVFETFVTSFFFLFSLDTMTDRSLNVPSESRMVIRRNRSPSGGRMNSIGSISEIRSPNYERSFRKKNSVPSRFENLSSGGIDFDPEDIERRRRRIRSINNIVPPLPVSSRYRGYLSKLEADALTKSSSTNSITSDTNNSTKSDTSSSTRLDISNLDQIDGSSLSRPDINNSTRLDTESSTRLDANNNHFRLIMKCIELDEDSGASDNGKTKQSIAIFTAAITRETKKTFLNAA